MSGHDSESAKISRHDYAEQVEVSAKDTWGENKLVAEPTQEWKNRITMLESRMTALEQACRKRSTIREPGLPGPPGQDGITAEQVQEIAVKAIIAVFGELSSKLDELNVDP